MISLQTTFLKKVCFREHGSVMCNVFLQSNNLSAFYVPGVSYLRINNTKNFEVIVMNFSGKMKDLPGASETVQDHRNLHAWSETSNETRHKLPINMRFNEGHQLSVIVYSILMVFSAIANTTVLVLILKRRRKTPSRINTMLTHLAIADLLVTFLMMPLEIGWASTVAWRAGDAMCRIMMFFRIFGLYLSSFILVCISIDRFYAVLKPLYLRVLDRRHKFMVVGAWIGATICSLPQMVVFHVESHPNVTWYEQCVTYNVFSNYAHELMYLMFGMIMMYAFPLVVIIFSYAAILMEICRRTRNDVDSVTRSSLAFLGKAKVRTLKMTIIIVLVFFICWTPYYVMCLWYWLDKDSAVKVDQRVQKGLFLFACTNSCMNPVVYGVFNIRARRTGRKVRPRANTITVKTSCIPTSGNDMRLSPLEISLKTLE